MTTGRLPMIGEHGGPPVLGYGPRYGVQRVADDISTTIAWFASEHDARLFLLSSQSCSPEGECGNSIWDLWDPQTKIA